MTITGILATVVTNRFCLLNIIVIIIVKHFRSEKSVYEKIMAIRNIISVLVILFLYEVITTNAQECDTLPSDSILESNLLSLLVSEGGEDPSIDPNLLTVMYTCMAQGMTMGSYREVSVIVTYNNVANSAQSRQFDLQCVLSGGNTGWQGIGGSLDSAPSGFETLETRTNCSQCSIVANNDHDCVGKGLCNILPLKLLLLICSFYHSLSFRL